MRPSNNLENKTLSDTLKGSTSMYQLVPLEYNQDQTLLMNQGSPFNHLGNYGNIMQFQISSRRENR